LVSDGRVGSAGQQGKNRSPGGRTGRSAPDQLKEYAGRYESDELAATYRLEVRDGRLWLRVNSRRWEPLDATVRDEFVHIQEPADIRIITYPRNEKGEVTGLSIDIGGRLRGVRFTKRGLPHRPGTVPADDSIGERYESQGRWLGCSCRAVGPLTPVASITATAVNPFLAGRIHPPGIVSPTRRYFIRFPRITTEKARVRGPSLDRLLRFTLRRSRRRAQSPGRPRRAGEASNRRRR
jgi:Domain of unknown function (DUF3471)